MTYGAVAYAAGEYAGPEAAPITPSATDEPVVSVQVAFTTDPGNPAPVWTVITDDREVLQEYSINRGRQFELDRFSAGRLTMTLANEDRRFDPTYTSSPYYPNVLPMRRIRVLATYGGVTYSRFTGYVDDWRQQYDHPQSATCQVSATDAFKVLAATELLSSPYAEEVDADRPAIWFRLGDTTDGPTPTTIDAVSGVKTLVPYGTPQFGATSLVPSDPDPAVRFPTDFDGLQGNFGEPFLPTSALTLEWLLDWESSTFGLPSIAIVSFNGTTVTSGIQVQMDTFTGGRVDALVLNGAGGSASASSTGVNVLNGATHHIAVTAAAGDTVKIYVDGVDVTGTTATFTGTFDTTHDSGMIINAGNLTGTNITGNVSTWDEVALYSTALSATRIAAHATTRTIPWSGDRSGVRAGRILDAGDWPAADRDLDTGLSTFQEAAFSGSVLEAIQKVEQSELGRLFVTTDGKVRLIGRDSALKFPYNTPQGIFGDSGTELEYENLEFRYDDQTIVNEAQVARIGGITAVARDTTSQARYLRRSKVFDGMLYQSDSTSWAFAAFLVNRYKNPLLRAVNMVLAPSAGNQATHFPQILGRELGDRVTVRRRPQNLGPAIDQATHIEGITERVVAKRWSVTWNLSPAETTTYWLAGVAGFGEAGVTTYAGV